VLELTKPEDTALQIKKTPITDKQILGWGFIIIVQAFALGGTYYSMTSKLENAAPKSAVERLATRFDAIEEFKTKTENNLSEIRVILNPLPFQLSQLTAAINDASRRADAVDVRLDKFNEQFSGKLDTLAETMNTIRVDVARIAASSGNSPPRPASFKP
jgi:hypothetical protein